MRWRTVRVFVCSTFRDMHAERDCLVKVVFPGLRERLRPFRVHLLDIDLRWGVTKAQAESNRVLDLCLDQIGECRPMFIGLLGERYGWTPTRVPAPTLRKYGWLGGQEGKSLTELEILHGVLNDEENCAYASFYFRQASALDEVPASLRSEVYEESEPGLRDKLASLKSRIRQSGCSIFEYPARWDLRIYDPSRRAWGRLGGLEPFGTAVLENLWHAIRKRLDLADEPVAPPQDPVASEREYHEQFVEARQLVYVRRRSIEKELVDYVQGQGTQALLVSGPPGSGKSALLAWLVRRLSDRCDVVVGHFAGASPSSASLRSTLTRLCSELDAVFGPPEAEAAKAAAAAAVGSTPEEAEPPPEVDQTTDLRARICRVPASARVVLVLDGLNQMEELRFLPFAGWLPRGFPPNVKVVLSCTDEGGGRAALLGALRARCGTEVLVGALTRGEGERIVAEVPSLSAKTLDRRQRDLLLDHPGSTTPLYLRVALEELRTFGSFERLTERIAAFPRGEDAIRGIFSQVFERLGQDFDPATVAVVLCALATARFGLDEQDLAALASGLPGKDDLQAILRQLRSYLQWRGGRLTYAHAAVADAVHHHYLAKPGAEQDWRRRLADHFEALGPASRAALTEVSWQRAEAGDQEGLVRVLTDFVWIERKADAGLVSDLLADFQRAATLLPPGHAWKANFRVLANAIGEHLHFLGEHPSALFQCLWNHCWWYDAPTAAEHYPPSDPGLAESPGPRLSTLLEAWRKVVDQRPSGHVWLRSLRPPPVLPGGPQLFRLVGRRGALGAAWSPGQSHVVVVSADGSTSVSDATTGQELIFVPASKALSYQCGALSADARRFAGASGHLYDEALHVWEVGDDQPILDLRPEPDGRRDHRYVVQDVAFSPDGRCLVAGAGMDVAEDPVVRIWDLDSGRETRRLEGHRRSAWCVAWSRDGARIVTGSADRTVRVWEAASGRELACLTGHGRTVLHVGFLTGNGRVWARDRNGVLLVWDVASGKVVGEAEGLLGYATTAEPSPDGRLWAAGTGFGEVLLVDLETWNVVDRLKGHTEAVRTVAFSAGGDRLLTAAADVRIWDLHSRMPSRIPRLRHTSVFSTRMEVAGPTVVNAGSDGESAWWVQALDHLGHETLAVNVPSRVQHSPDRVGFSPGGAWIYCLERRRSLWMPVGLFGLPEEKNLYHLRLWHASTGAELLCISGKELEEPLWVFSADGRRLLVSSDGQSIQAWDLASRTQITDIESPTGASRVLALSDDGQWAAGGGKGGWWARPLEGGTPSSIGRESISALCFSPDSKFLAGYDLAGMVRLWRLADGRQFTCEHVNAALGRGCAQPRQNCVLAFSPGCERLLATDGSVTATWETQTGTLIDWREGVSDLRAVARGGHPWLPFLRGNATVIVETPTDREIARYPAPMRDFQVDADGHTFLGRTFEARGYLAWLKVEGSLVEALDGESAIQARLKAFQDAALPEAVAAVECACKATGRTLNAGEKYVAVERASRDLADFGPLYPLLTAAEVSTLRVDSSGEVEIVRDGSVSGSQISVPDLQWLRRLADQFFRMAGQRLDESVDARSCTALVGPALDARVETTAPPGSSRLIVSFTKRGPTKRLADILAAGELSEPLAGFLVACIEARLRILLSGPDRAAVFGLLEALLAEAALLPVRDHEELIVELKRRRRWAETNWPAVGGLVPSTDPDPWRLIRIVAAARRAAGLPITPTVYGGSDLQELRTLLTLARVYPDDGLFLVFAGPFLRSGEPARTLSVRQTLERLQVSLADDGAGLWSLSRPKSFADSLDLVVQVLPLRSGGLRVEYVTEVHPTGEEAVIPLMDLFYFDRVRGRYRSSGLRPRFHDKLMRTPHGRRLPNDLDAPSSS